VEAAQIPVERGRSGNRWVNYRPEATEIADWFQTIRLHEGMEHEDWLSGITLIEATEKHDHIVGFAQDGRPQIMKDVQSLHLIPYTRVDARVAYFNRLMEIHEDWSGFILPVPAADPKGMAVGFYAMKVALPDGKIATAVCYTARVLVIEGDVKWAEHVDPDGVTRLYPLGNVVMAGAHGTKSVPLVDRWGRFDANAVMKAQTGGVGRALGYAGMLVIPGTGVATAEDMREALDQGARERKFRKLSEVQGPALKGLVKKLQKIRDEVQAEPPEGAQAELLLDGDEAATPVETPQEEETL
jgi:hypothetical protein